MCVIQFPAGRQKQRKSRPGVETRNGFAIGDCVKDATGRLKGLGVIVDTFLSTSTLSPSRYAVRFGDRVLDLPPSRLARTAAHNDAFYGGAA